MMQHPIVHTLILCVVLGISLVNAQDDYVFNPDRGEVRFVIFGDFNGAYGSTSYSSLVYDTLHNITHIWRPNLVLSPGDVIAGQSQSLPVKRFYDMWAAFDDNVASMLRNANVPYAVAMGNHDASNQQTPDDGFQFQRERDAAYYYWNQLMYQGNLAYHSREQAPFNFSFSFANTFIAVIDASGPHVTQSTLSWLEAQLSSTAAKNARLRFVMGHLPLYGVSEGKNKQGEVLYAPEELQAVLERHKVYMYISGHHAAYYPAKQGHVELLHAGGIGGRTLLGSTEEARSVVVVLDIWPRLGRVVQHAFDVRDFSLIDPYTLPVMINGINGPIYRSDITEAEVDATQADPTSPFNGELDTPLITYKRLNQISTPGTPANSDGGIMIVPIHMLMMSSSTP